MPFEIVRNDITNMKVDVIVNAASRFPRVNAGVDSAIHQKAGPALLDARKKIGFIAPGNAAITPAFSLNANFVIHAATPTWLDGLHREKALLRQTYDRCLTLALKHNCHSIAFPLLAAGNHAFPKDQALQIAINAFSAFLMEHEMQIYLVVFNRDVYRLSEKLFHSVASYIDEYYVAARELVVEEDRCCPPARQEIAACRRAPQGFRPTMAASKSKTLEEMLLQTDAGFTETLLKLIDKTGKKDSEIYKKANISKQHFSKIRNNPQYKPTKATALALALALELNLEETRDLIGRAGYALTSSSKFDLIIRYFIENRNYNVVEINCVLFQHDQSLLGA